jgi:hypothetical protein
MEHRISVRDTKGNMKFIFFSFFFLSRNTPPYFCYAAGKRSQPTMREKKKPRVQQRSPENTTVAFSCSKKFLAQIDEAARQERRPHP